MATSWAAARYAVLGTFCGFTAAPLTPLRVMVATSSPWSCRKLKRMKRGASPAAFAKCWLTTTSNRRFPRVSAFRCTAAMASESKSCSLKQTAISTQKKHGGEGAQSPQPIPAVVFLKLDSFSRLLPSMSKQGRKHKKEIFLFILRNLQLIPGDATWFFYLCDVSPLLLSNGIAIGIHDVHRPKVQVANSGLHLCKVPDHDPHQSIRVEKRLPRGREIVCRQGPHLGCIRRVVVVGQTILHDILYRISDLGHSFARTRQAKGSIVLVLTEFILRDGTSAKHIAQLFVELNERFFRLIRLHRRLHHPGAVAARKLKRRASAVRPVLVLAQVHVYAPAERSAQNVVPDSQRNFLRVVARRCDRSRQDKRLRRARFIDQIYFGLFRCRYVRNALLRRIPLLPGSKSLFELRFDFSRRGVAHDHQRSVIRSVPRVVEFGDRVARQFGDARFG